MIEQASLKLPKKDIDLAYSILIHAYAQTEAEIWGENYVRISREEYEQLIEKGEIFFSFDKKSVNGCIQIKQMDQKTFSFGLLASNFEKKGSGIGKKLIAFAEQYAKEKRGEKMVLEILRPADFKLEFKEFLHLWYSKMGYQYVETIPFLGLKTEKIEKAKQLKVPAVFDCYSKKII